MADENDKLFRKVALERLSSPDQLDSLMRVITPKAWLALLPLAAIIVLAIAWGWFGSLPTKVSGKCILLNPTGLADVASASAGRITDFMVKVGDQVAAGAEIARVAQPDLVDRIDKAQARVKELEAQDKVVRSFAQQGADLTQQSLAQQRTMLESQIGAARERARFARERARVAAERAALARERIGTQQQLFDQGLVTSQSVLAVRQEEAAARQEESAAAQEETAANLEAKNLDNQIRQLPLTRLERDKQGRNEIANIEAQLAEARRQLDSLVEAKKLAVTIASPHAGRVTEIRAGNGMLVSQGSPVVTIELAGGKPGSIEAVIYVPVADGWRVAPKMEAQIAPSTVRREEHGFLRAEVAYVSDYPATPQSMMLLMQNDALVKELAGATPLTEIRARLIAADNFSGYQWSSARGPSVKLASGTVCAADVVVERQRPLSLVVPILRKNLGLD